jgi:hypothetical protein
LKHFRLRARKLVSFRPAYFLQRQRRLISQDGARGGQRIRIAFQVHFWLNHHQTHTLGGWRQDDFEFARSQ